MKWLYSVCLVLLLMIAPSCRSTPPSELPKFVTSAIKVARGIGDAVLRAKGAAELQRSVPELVPLIDTDPATPGVITIAEVEAFLTAAAEDPESVALLVATLVLLRQ